MSNYELRLFGVILEGTADVLYDNPGSVENMSILESVLRNKNNSVNYHSVRDALAAYILWISKYDGETNMAYLLTKVMTGQKRWDLCYHIFC